MLTGRVDAQLQPIIGLTVRGPTGIARHVEALVDTGFAGSLTLPMSLIRVLALPWDGREIGIMADGTVHSFEVFLAGVEWDGTVRTISVFAADSQPLIGAELLAGHDLFIRMVNGGAVTIAAAP